MASGKEGHDVSESGEAGWSVRMGDAYCPVHPHLPLNCTSEGIFCPGQSAGEVRDRFLDWVSDVQPWISSHEVDVFAGPIDGVTLTRIRPCPTCGQSAPVDVLDKVTR